MSITERIKQKAKDMNNSISNRSSSGVWNSGYQSGVNDLQKEVIHIVEPLQAQMKRVEIVKQAILHMRSQSDFAVGVGVLEYIATGELEKMSIDFRRMVKEQEAQK